MAHLNSGLSLDAHAVADDVTSFLRQLPFLRSLADAELLLLGRAVEHLSLPAGTRVMREGEPSAGLYLVFRGSVEVIKAADSTAPAGDGGDLVIHRIERGSVFGEMSFIDGDPASATIRAAADCELLRITPAALDVLENETTVPLRDRLNGAVALAVIRRLRLLSDNHVRALQREIEQVRLRSEFERFFMATVVLFGIASLVQKLIQTDVSPWAHMAYSWGFLLLSVAPMAWFARRQRRSWAEFGVTLTGWRRSLLEGLGVTAVLTGVALLVAQLGVRAPGAPLLTFGSVASYTGPQFALFVLGYPLHSFLQEFIGRGVIQNTLAHFMPQAGRMVPILLTSALFGVYHLYVSISFALLTVAVSMLFGWLYARHRTLCGVTVLHTAIGLVSVALGFN